MDTVYIETSIVNHATARASPDPATATMQDQARRWMAEQRPKYAVMTSQLVLAEAARGALTPPLDDLRCWPIFPFSAKTRMSTAWLTN